MADDPYEFEPLIDIIEVARLFKFTPQHIRRLAEQQIIPGVKYGKGWRFRRSDLTRAHEEALGLRITEVPSVPVEQPKPPARRPRGRPVKL